MEVTWAAEYWNRIRTRSERSVQSMRTLKAMAITMMDTVLLQQDLCHIALSDTDSEPEKDKCLDIQREKKLENLGICTKPYGYALDYFDRKSVSPCFLCDQQFEHYAFTLEHLEQAHFLSIPHLEDIIDVPL